MVIKMKFSWRKAAVVICAVVGALSWLYIGVYRLWKGPFMDLIQAKVTGRLSIGVLFDDLVRAFICLTAAGFFWCLWYILRGYFKGKK